jgi:NitT/TauT family transport system permease protein
MGMTRPHTLSVNGRTTKLLPNQWDLAAFLIILGGLVAVVVALREVQVPLDMGRRFVSLDMTELPHYAFRTTLRMLVALGCSLLFTFGFGALAAKSRHAELLLIPILDILQSVPVLGYISFTVIFFMSLFPGKVMGAELAVVFAIFTSQAWNMTFSFYQSLRTVPRDLEEAARSFNLSAWQRFWRLDVPFAIPGLVGNMMMSMSGGWFFVVASEAISVGDTRILLPGVGAYVATAIQDRDLKAVGLGLATMVVVILLYDQLMFRPLVAWSDKFRFEHTAGSEAPPRSWVLSIIRRTRLLGAMLAPIHAAFRVTMRLRFPASLDDVPMTSVLSGRLTDWLWYGAIGLGTGFCSWHLFGYLAGALGWADLVEVTVLTAWTLLRVVLAVVVSSLIWVPIGVWIGLRPYWTAKIQPLAQILAAFPANLMFPVAVVTILRFHMQTEVWVIALMILGNQWYVLFNVIAGASAFPNDLREVATNLHLKGWRWWRSVMLPGIFPYFVTGAITATGGAWNASIVAEYLKWGDSTIAVTGIGAYIARVTEAGDYPRIILGIAVMSRFVTVLDRLLWYRLYTFASRFLRLE